MSYAPPRWRSGLPFGSRRDQPSWPEVALRWRVIKLFVPEFSVELDGVDARPHPLRVPVKKESPAKSFEINNLPYNFEFL